MKGFVYKIESDCKQILYIGSTTSKLSYRFGSHKTNSHCVISKYLKDTKYTFSSGCELIKEYNVVDKGHLLAYEQLWMNKFKKNINHKNAFKITFKQQISEYKKEWASNNKEKLKDYKKLYYLENKDKIKQRASERHIKSKPLYIEALSFI